MLSLAPDAEVRLEYADFEQALVSEEVDCRLLFAGPPIKDLAAAYGEAVEHFTALDDPTILRRALSSSPLVGRFYAMGGPDDDPSILLRDDVFREPGPGAGLSFVFRVSSAGRTVSRRATLCDLLALGALCPLLWGSHDAAGIRTALSASLPASTWPWATALLDELLKVGLLDSRGRPVSRFHRRPPLPRVDFLGHASLLVQTERTSVLFDPLVRPGTDGALRSADVASLDLDAICCSHSHWDHCNLQTLIVFDKTTPVIVPRVKRPTLFNPPMVSALQRLGFTDVREVEPWEPVTIGDIEIVPTPFHGEQDEPGAEIDHFTYVVRADGLTFYGGADCYRDTFGEMEPVLAEIAARYQPSIAFLPISKVVVAYRTGGINNFCRYLDRELLDRSFQYTGGPEDTVALAEAIRSPLIVPYATFTLARWDLPDQVRVFHRELRRRHLARRLHPLLPFDSLTPLYARRSWLPAARRQALSALFGASPALNLARRALRRGRRLLARRARRIVPVAE